MKDPILSFKNLKTYIYDLHTYIQPIHFQIDLSAWSGLFINEGDKLDEEKNEYWRNTLQLT